MSKLDEMMKDCAEFERGCLVQGHKVDSVKRKDSAFSEMVNKLQKREGYSKKVATETAAKIGRQSIGAHEMANRAAASRARHKRG